MTKFKWKLLLLVEVLICVLCFWGYIKDEKKYYFDYQSIISDGICLENFLDSGKTGYYIDSSSEAKSNFAITPKISLKPGNYKVLIYYQSNSYQQTYTISAEKADFREWLGNYYKQLPETKNIYSTNLWLTRTLDNFQLQFDYSGDGYFFLSGVDIIENNNWILALSLFFLLFFILIDFIIWHKDAFMLKVRNKDNINVIMCIALIIIFSSLPLFSPYLFNGHDLNFHLMRIEGIMEGIQSGQFPVKIQPNWLNGYGYGTSFFYGDVFLYIPAILRLIGFNVQNAYKLFVLIINIVSTIISYYCFRRLLGNRKLGILCAFLYTTSVYRLGNIFIRAAVGEYTAMIFLPMVLVGVYEILYLSDKKYKRNSWLIAAIGFSGILLSHIITCEIVALIAVIICLINWKKSFKKERLIEFVKMIFTILLLTIWFIVPFVDMSRGDYVFNNSVEWNGIQTSGVFISQLLTLFPQASGWSFEYTVINGVNIGEEFSFALGGGFLISFILFLLFYINNKNYNDKDLKVGKYFWILGIVLTFMTTIYFPWNDLQSMNEIFYFMISNIQFPWRFLGLVTAFFSIATCVTVKMIKYSYPEKENLVIVLILIFAVISSGSLLSDRINNNYSVVIKNKDDLETFDLMGKEYVPINAILGKMTNSDVLSSDGISLNSVERKYQKHVINCTNTTDKSGYIDLPLLYYKGYVCKNIDNGTQLFLTDNEIGGIRIEIPANFRGTLVVNYKEMWYWRTAELISLLSISSILLYYLKGIYIINRKASDVQI